MRTINMKPVDLGGKVILGRPNEHNLLDWKDEETSEYNNINKSVSEISGYSQHFWYFRVNGRHFENIRAGYA